MTTNAPRLNGEARDGARDLNGFESRQLSFVEGEAVVDHLRPAAGNGRVAHLPTPLHLEAEQPVGEVIRPKALLDEGQGRASAVTVSVVIPAKNEARNLPTVLDRIPKEVHEVILVDGHSTDVTEIVAMDCLPDIRIIREDRPGKGSALRTGFAAATGEIVVALDADGSMAPEEIPNFVYFLQHGFDFVKGSRFIGGGGSLDITPFRRFGNRALLAVANRKCHSNFTDLCYGYFAFYKKYLGHLGLLSSGFEIEAEVLLRAVRAGLRIAEIPSLEFPRRTGESALRTFPDGARVLRTLLRERPGSIAAPIS